MTEFRTMPIDAIETADLASAVRYGRQVSRPVNLMVAGMPPLIEAEQKLEIERAWGEWTKQVAIGEPRGRM